MGNEAELFPNTHIKTSRSRLRKLVSQCPFLLTQEGVNVIIKHCSSEYVFSAFLTTFANVLILLPDNLARSLAYYLQFGVSSG